MAQDAGRVLVEGHDFFSAPRLSPDRQAARMAELGPSRHALGQHHAVVCRNWRGRGAWGGPQDRGRRARSDRPAGMVARRPALFRVRPQRLVEHLPGVRRRRRFPSARCLPNLPGRPGRSAAAGMASSVPRRSSPASARTARWHLARLDVATGRLSRLDLPYSAFGGIAVEAAARAARRRVRPAGGDRRARSGERRGHGAVHGRRGAGRCRLSRAARADRVRERRRHGACLLLSADQSRLRRTGRRAAAA